MVSLIMRNKHTLKLAKHKFAGIVRIGLVLVCLLTVQTVIVQMSGMSSIVAASFLAEKR